MYVSYGSFTMSGGTISGNTGGGGGGVNFSHGSFTMSGGTISGNTATSNGGGGVYVNSGPFTMSGGSIRGNTATSNGGGVCISNGSSFTMSGDAEISGNTATTGSGGGVYVNDSSFTKTGGAIYGDTDTTHPTGSNDNTAGSGDGHAVYVSATQKRNATAGPEVNLDSTKTGTAEGWDQAEFHVSSSGNDGTGQGTEAAPFATLGKALEAIKAAYTGNWSGKGTAAATPARIIISGTTQETGGTNGLVDISDTLLYAAWPPVTLEGKGTGADAGTLDATGRNKRVLYMRFADVTLEQNLTLTGGSADSGGGVLVSNGSFTMSGGTIGGNTATGDGGGGVYLIDASSFAMSGGAISGNTAANGGGVCFNSSGSFTMSGGTISDNTATTGDGGGVNVSSSGTFTMEGGSISGNTANGIYSRGGGVYASGSFTKTGGTIYGDTDTTHTAGDTENTAGSGNGHAVYVGAGQRRNANAGQEVNLDSTKTGTAGGWE
jgi:hypothetical protein